MDLEYGGSRSFSTYMWRKEELTPLNYNKKYSAEIEQAEGSDKKNKREDSRNRRQLFTNCNFYIDDFVSFFSLYNTCDKSHNKDEGVQGESPCQMTTLYRGDGYKVGPQDEWNNFTNHAEEKTVYRYYNNFSSQSKCITPYNNSDLGGGNNYVNFGSSDYERPELTKLHDRHIEEADMSLDKTPTKSNQYDLAKILEGTHTSRDRNEFDTFVKRYETVQTRKRNVHASYINKKEQIEIMIVQNGGVIHNALTSKVTHIISNNMALGSKKYMDYKKAIKKSKIFIVVDKYIFDCVKFQCRLPEQSYLPSVLRYNSRQITEFFPVKKSRRRRSVGGEVPSLVASNVHSRNCTPVLDHRKGGEECIVADSPQKGVLADDSSSGKRLTDHIPIDKHLLMLNMHMSYKNLKNYIVCNCSEYFRRLRTIYLKKELEENAFPNVSPNLYINKNTFEEFSRKYRILSHLNETEINWIKKKSELNIKVKNVWENDMLHFFFDTVLKKKDSDEVASSMGSTSREGEQAEVSTRNSDDVISADGGGEAGSTGEGANGSNHPLSEGYASDKLIESIKAYLYNSRMYILGNWKYISREFFKFEDINENDRRKCVYLYIDFDNYFLSASVKNASDQHGMKKKMGNHEILCVCHSLKKEESYSIISATNYWGKKNKISNGMVKWEITKMHKDNIRYIKYNFCNILRCSYLFLLILMNYSRNVRVHSVDESIVQLFYENEQDIYIKAKQIAEDIYNLTNLSVSIGISSNLIMSRKAVKFCKKRFLFFDYYHHFCIFIMGKYFSGRDINGQEAACSTTSQNNVQKQRSLEQCDVSSVTGDHNEGAGTEQGDGLVKEGNYAAEGHTTQNAPFNFEDLENLFDEYVASAVAGRNQVNASSDCTTRSPSDEYFLNAMKNKRDPRVDSIFNKFVQANRANMEDITNTFFDQVIHPISKFFFFYKKNEHYMDVLRQLNYLNGEFIHFNIYNLPVDKNDSPVPCDDLPEATLIKLKKKDTDPIDGKKCIHISVNYGVRFQYINDFYFLIYFMTKQLYIRLRIQKLKAKGLHVYFFFNMEGEHVHPLKYFGRGKVARVSKRIQLTHYTDNFFVYFFKVIYTFDTLTSSLTQLRGIQIMCSDVVSGDALHARGMKSILFYFPMGERENRKVVEEAKLQPAVGVNLPPAIEPSVGVKIEPSVRVKIEPAEEVQDITPNIRVPQVRPAWENNAKDAWKRATHVPRHHRCGRGGKSKHKKCLPLIDGRRRKSILYYFFNTKNKAEAEKEVDMSSNKCIPFSFKSGAKEINKINNKHKNNASVRRMTTPLPPRSSKMTRKIKTTRNYKILDFFPQIFMNRQRQSNTITTAHSDHMNKWKDRNVVTTDMNIFDSIINKRVKKEAHIKEEFNCCYSSFRNILEDVMEKQKGPTTMCESQHVCANESVNDTIFCHSYIIPSLYSMNRESEKGILYTYTKEIISSYISYFNNLFHNHDCGNDDATDRYYLLKFVATVVENLCEELHRKRLLDVLHKFLKNFKHAWCLSCEEEEKEEKGSGNGENNSFPSLFHRIMVKYGVCSFDACMGTPP
ncbi:hypothetical protein AK88_00846 [Plasmodium fragile]|uniref:DNA repair protein REV1 n=1 Tax=Plasmodium fragile TaxID=5857 RepID=A0A0D9QR34_PLAFR|nr:uncharacterized protein AK88_00846 [Plasmodium fragile]KJP89403.1 hypothetical protein AK88_00846 [Plasmodium fragile]